jgi:hypothetical protein
MAVDPNAEPFLYEGQYGTGALWKPADPRDFDMRRLPGVRELLRVGYPAEHTENQQHVVHTYHQGSTPACVWHTIAGLQTANEHKERRGEKIIFDAMGMHAATGPMDQGRWPQDMLKVAQDTGTKVAGATKRYRVGSYAFAPKSSPEIWVDTMKAALAAGHLCMIASVGDVWVGDRWPDAG